MMKIETLKQLSQEKKKLKAACIVFEEEIKIKFEYLQDNAGEMAADSIENIISKFSIKRFIKRFFHKGDDPVNIGSFFSAGKGNKIFSLALSAGLAIGLRYFKKWFNK